MCPSQLYGAHGAIGLWFNLFPALFRGIYTAVRDGEVDRAMEGQHRLTDFAEIPWRWGIRPIFERLMIERGQCRRVFRAPRVELDDETYARAAPMIRERIEAIETWGEAQPAEKR